MSEHPNLSALADDIRSIHAAGGPKAEESVADYLTKRLGSLPAEERIAALEQLKRCFTGSKAAALLHPDDNQEVVARLFSLILGKPVHPADLSSSELLRRLAESLNTIFDTLNRLVGLIQSTFSGGTDPEETIRQVIGVHLEGEDRTESLETYLGQIGQAFLTAQRASQQAARETVSRILTELDPNKFDQNGKIGLKFGPLRKAELFDMYRERYEICRKWFDSGRFMQDFSREFERQCQRSPDRGKP